MIDVRYYRECALRTRPVEIAELSIFDGIMVRATEWLFVNLIKLESTSDPVKYPELKTYITDSALESILVDRCIRLLYKALYTYIYLDRGGLTDEHLDWFTFGVICGVLGQYHLDFDRRALPVGGDNLGREMLQRAELYDAIQRDGLATVQARQRELAVSNHDAVRAKATFSLG